MPHGSAVREADAGCLARVGLACLLNSPRDGCAESNNAEAREQVLGEMHCPSDYENPIVRNYVS